MYQTTNNELKLSRGTQSKKVWRTPVLTEYGNFSGLVLVGLGKLSPPAVDPGEPKKTRPDG
jgi:hypothetical protein